MLEDGKGDKRRNLSVLPILECQPFTHMEETAEISEGQDFPDPDWKFSHEERSQSGQKKGREERQN